MKYIWRYDIISMIAEGTELNNIHQKILAEYLIDLSRDFEARSKVLLQQLETIPDIFTKVYSGENYFNVGKDKTGRMYELKIQGEFSRNQAFRELDKRMKMTLDIRNPNPSKLAIIGKAKHALFRFNGEQVSLLKYYHQYDGYSEAGYVFVYNGAQDMGELTSPNGFYDLENPINDQYREIDRRFPNLFRMYDSESKALRSDEERNDLAGVLASHYELWSEFDICDVCDALIQQFIQNNDDRILSFIAYDGITDDPNGRFQQYK
ncbi:MAG: hypothetical protein P8Y97_16870 [Candidatus Lokiarchaeota archaeon]